MHREVLQENICTKCTNTLYCKCSNTCKIHCKCKTTCRWIANAQPLYCNRKTPASGLQMHKSPYIDEAQHLQEIANAQTVTKLQMHRLRILQMHNNLREQSQMHKHLQKKLQMHNHLTLQMHNNLQDNLRMHNNHILILQTTKSIYCKLTNSFHISSTRKDTSCKMGWSIVTTVVRNSSQFLVYKY